MKTKMMASLLVMAMMATMAMAQEQSKQQVQAAQQQVRKEFRQDMARKKMSHDAMKKHRQSFKHQGMKAWMDGKPVVIVIKKGQCDTSSRQEFCKTHPCDCKAGKKEMKRQDKHMRKAKKYMQKAHIQMLKARQG